ncbi:F-box domain-containing protein [Colletotrichum karsti]|uniref:F-box domain-containing protein n=1 Tax=Colletotrichum karsti TaxID=1095194 RepID=A0A9P6LH50_9PEZI|nr:F-box domain-containing protein [Colletotrichum karsti]KAF9872162.1 F-box domain-containing protein [Colletotrichum karsti]
MQRKRQPSPAGAGTPPISKRPRHTEARPCSRPTHSPDSEIAFAADDFLSSLSDELLIRILSFLPTSILLGIAPVSRRFYRLSSDSQLWRLLYYHRFVLPRALRIPGFRDGSAKEGTRVHFSSRRTVWADGGWGRRDGSGQSLDWKRQYKLRHNWARGKATVEELKVGDTGFNDLSRTRKTLAKVIEGIAVTADGTSGLRAWNLKTREPIAQIGLKDGTDDSIPTCIAIDDQAFGAKNLDVSVGFLDGSFGVWRLHLDNGRFLRRYKHETSSNGSLIEIAYRHPFILTATESVLISLYNFEQTMPSKSGTSAQQNKQAIVQDESETVSGSESATLRESESEMQPGLLKQARPSRVDNSHSGVRDTVSLRAPILLTSLKSHSSRAPLALSIRQMASYVIASIAYTFPTREGWSIGIQDLQVRRRGDGGLSTAEIESTRLAFTSSVKAPSSLPPSSRENFENGRPSPPLASDGPTTLCYNHPYLLAAMADNTLILHVCTSNATQLSVSSGIRLWGHTSGISDAEITARGKAVSVSSRGEEIRVWELEGRVSGKSIEIRQNSITDVASQEGVRFVSEPAPGWDDRRNWVGFDDEMVIVLKESKDGKESLVVYDFS